MRNVALGKRFVFEGRDWNGPDMSKRVKRHSTVLPAPEGAGYTGKWVKVGTRKAFTPKALALAFDKHPKRMAGTWTWQRG